MSTLEEELYEAVNNNNVDCVKELLRRGANVNILVHSGRTILGRAVQLGNVDVIKVLLHAEDYLPSEDNFENEEIEDVTSLECYLEPGFLSWNQDNNETNQENIDQGNSRAEDNSCWTENRLSLSDGWKEPPQPSLGGLVLFQSLRKFTFHRRKCDVNLPDFYDRMPIHYAAEGGKVEVLDMLLKAGCRVNVSDSENITPLHLAVSRGHEEITVMLLSAGSRVNSKTSDKSSALHIAASRGYPGIVEKLLNFGAKIDILDASDRTPLFLAINRANHQVVRILLHWGAKVNVEEIHGYTPLSEAVWQKDCDLVQLLIQNGAKVTGVHHLLHYTVLHHSLQLTELLLNGGAFVNVRDDSGDTPLHIAVRGAEVEILKVLLKHGGNIGLCNGLSGQTLIHEAVEGIQEQNFDVFCTILHILIQRGCKLNVESFTPGDTPLYRAILLDKFIFAEELIRNGSDVNMGNLYSCNIDNLCLARRKNHFHTVKLLVYAGFYLHRTPWLEILPSPFPHNYTIHSIKGWLIYMKGNPMNLVDICRIVIRRRLGENLAFKVSKLQFPLHLKRFLLLQNIAADRDPIPILDSNNANVSMR